MNLGRTETPVVASTVVTAWSSACSEQRAPRRASTTVPVAPVQRVKLGPMRPIAPPKSVLPGSVGGKDYEGLGLRDGRVNVVFAREGLTIHAAPDAANVPPEIAYRSRGYGRVAGARIEPGRRA